MDAVNFNPTKVSSVEYKSLETGQEDHAIEEDWMKKNESLDTLVIKKKEIDKKAVEFNKSVESLGTTNMSIHEATINQSSNLTAAQGSSNVFAFSDGLNRGQGIKGRSDYTTASNIYKIQAVEFVDIREQLYRKLDPFFSYVRPKRCP